MAERVEDDLVAALVEAASKEELASWLVQHRAAMWRARAGFLDDLAATMNVISFEVQGCDRIKLVKS